MEPYIPELTRAIVSSVSNTDTKLAAAMSTNNFRAQIANVIAQAIEDEVMEQALALTKRQKLAKKSQLLQAMHNRMVERRQTRAQQASLNEVIAAENARISASVRQQQELLNNKQQQQKQDDITDKMANTLTNAEECEQSLQEKSEYFQSIGANKFTGLTAGLAATSQQSIELAKSLQNHYSANSDYVEKLLVKFNDINELLHKIENSLENDDLTAKQRAELEDLGMLLQERCGNIEQKINIAQENRLTLENVVNEHAANQELIDKQNEKLNAIKDEHDPEQIQQLENSEVFDELQDAAAIADDKMQSIVKLSNSVDKDYLVELSTDFTNMAAQFREVLQNQEVVIAPKPTPTPSPSLQDEYSQLQQPSSYNDNPMPKHGDSTSESNVNMFGLAQYNSSNANMQTIAEKNSPSKNLIAGANQGNQTVDKPKKNVSSPKLTQKD